MAYEIKHAGFRFICHRDSERVRVFSRTGHDWSKQVLRILSECSINYRPARCHCGRAVVIRSL
jgi:ATP-dependent DNA ligase